MTLKKVTVIVPAYNAERYISGAIESVIGQTYKNIDLIVIDDGSTDRTGELVRRYGYQVRYIRQENGGPSKARNTGIRAADSELIAFLDADDVWLPEKIQIQVDLLEDNPDLGLVFCDAEFMDEKGRSYGSVWKQRGCYEAMVAESRRLSHAFATVMMMDCILPSAVLVRRTCLDRAGLFDESLRYVEDKDLMLRIALTSEMGCVPRPLMKRLRHGYSHSQVENVYESVIFVVTRMQQLHPEQFRSHHIDTNALLAPTYYQLGRCYLDQDKLPEARRAFWASVQLRLSGSALGFWAVTLMGLVTIRTLRRLKHIAVGRPVCQTSEYVRDRSERG